MLCFCESRACTAHIFLLFALRYLRVSVLFFRFFEEMFILTKKKMCIYLLGARARAICNLKKCVGGGGRRRLRSAHYMNMWRIYSFFFVVCEMREWNNTRINICWLFNFGLTHHQNSSSRQEQHTAARPTGHCLHRACRRTTTTQQRTTRISQSKYAQTLAQKHTQTHTRNNIFCNLL